MAGICELCNEHNPCFQHALPFNHLGDDQDFFLALLELKTDHGIDTQRLSNMCFNPLIYIIQFGGNSDIDPDANCYSNTQNYSSDYLFCDQFNEMNNKYKPLKKSYAIQV